MLSGASLISRVCPLKRILCICPVPKAIQTAVGYDQFEMGLAISDPYLSFASPIGPLDEQRDVLHSFEIHVQKTRDSNHPCINVLWSDLPCKAEDFMDQVGFHDIGAVALALPMKSNGSRTSLYLEDERINAVRRFIRKIFKNYESSPQFKLSCLIEDRFTIDEARVMAIEEPQMWEDVELETLDNDRVVSPSIHACAALNKFLYLHIGRSRKVLIFVVSVGSNAHSPSSSLSLQAVGQIRLGSSKQCSSYKS